MRGDHLAFLALVWISGCGPAPPDPVSGPAAAAAAAPRKLRVALLGDDVRVAIVEDLSRNDSLEIIVPPPDADASAAAQAAFDSDVVLLVTDAMQGPLPMHHELALILRQVEAASIALLFVNTEQLSETPDGVELLELEELELRETLNNYSLPGDTITCLYDAQVAATDRISGLAATAEWLKGQQPRAHPSPNLTAARDFSAEIYLMSRQESAHARSLTNGDTVRLFINGHLGEAAIHSDAQLPPGSSSPARIRLNQSLRCAMGNRFVVMADGHVIGAGLITSIGR